jgi:hypothetical protein
MFWPLSWAFRGWGPVSGADRGARSRTRLRFRRSQARADVAPRLAERSSLCSDQCPRQDSNLRTRLRRGLHCRTLTRVNMVCRAPPGRVWGATRKSGAGAGEVALSVEAISWALNLTPALPGRAASPPACAAYVPRSVRGGRRSAGATAPGPGAATRTTIIHAAGTTWLTAIDTYDPPDPPPRPRSAQATSSPLTPARSPWSAASWPPAAAPRDRPDKTTPGSTGDARSETVTAALAARWITIEPRPMDRESISGPQESRCARGAASQDGSGQ